ncbi:MAG: FliI/YscN family ATPase [Planctomycetales bacterium]|nr:FliI/YscN family ATPase [Planctomycetales bacterium]
MMKLDLERLSRDVESCDGFRLQSRLQVVEDGLACALPAALGDQCLIYEPSGRTIPAEVVGFKRGLAKLAPYERAEELRSGLTVVRLPERRSVPVGNGILGRIFDGLGRPYDDLGPVKPSERRIVRNTPPSALKRERIQQPFITGQKAIDGLLLCGRGQRLGIFAGSGVGKSTLLGQIAKTAEADLNIICLVGERGCELKPFIEDSLGEDGLARSAVVISSSDQLPLMRIRAVETSIAMADSFRARGKNVLFFLDSLTRLAMAQRELGLTLGEPPSARGYTPSVFQLLANTVEQLGNGVTGSITGFLTVLVEGDDLGEPVADSARSLLDGHIVLDRKIAESGHFPPINVGQSVSRAFLHVSEPAQQLAARKIRDIMSTYEGVRDLLRIGAYVAGSSPQVDLVVKLMPQVNAFLQQGLNEPRSHEQTCEAMQRLAAAWPY